MKYKDINEDNIKYARDVYFDKSSSWDSRMATLCQYFDKSERTVRYWLVALGIKHKQDVEPEQYEKARKKEVDLTKKRFMVTWAQNNTPVHKKFFNKMLSYADYINAEILVIPGRYSNRMETLNKDTKESWSEELLPYLTAKRVDLCKNLTILADIKVNATAVNPLTSLESLSTDNTSILGHPRIQMKTLPIFNINNKPRMMFSTGTCTNPNFTDSKIGAIGHFHATYGFVIVEIKDDNETYFIRQVSATENGDFIDLYHEVNDEGITRVKESLALIKGDIHYGNHDQKVLDVSFNELIPKVKPRQILLHDVIDCNSINHHEAKNFIRQYRNEVEGLNSLKKEIDELIVWLNKIKDLNIVIVRSNHDDFIDRWIINSDPKKDIKNAVEYMDYAKILLEDKAPNGILPYIINQKIPQIKCLNRNESYKIGKWQLGMHGMDGINGSKGSVNQFRKINEKSISGHSHTPSRFDGALQVGTNTKLRMGYNNGISSWAWSDVLINANGKAQHIIYVGDNREFTTFK